MESPPDDEGSTPESTDYAAPVRRRPWLKIAVVLVVALILGATTVALLPRTPNTPPILDGATVSAESSIAAELLTFQANATDPDGDALAYIWSFGDNATAAGRIVTHAYSLPGRYVVLLTVRDGKGGEATNDGMLLFIRIRSRPSDIAPPPPPSSAECLERCTVGPASASLVANHTVIAAGMPVRFSANASWVYTWAWNNVSNHSEGGAAIPVSTADQPSLFPTLTYRWGDGSAYVGGNAESVGRADHVYMAPGIFFVRLTVTVQAIGGTLSVSAGYTIRVTSGPPQALTKHPVIFTKATFGEPDSLDPAVDAETSGGEILQNVYESLVWYQPGSENVTVLVPRLATVVPSEANGGISPDGRNYTFSIRPDVRFHSGALMTPDDVVYSIRRVLAMHDPAGPSWILEQVLTNFVANYVDGCDGACTLADYADSAFPSRSAIPPNIRTVLEAAAPEANWTERPMNRTVAWAVSNSTVERLSPTEVVIHLTRPYPAFLQALASTVGSVVEKACAQPGDGWGIRNEFLDHQDDCGTGPYMLDRWIPNDVIVLIRFGGYWRTPAPSREVHFEKVIDVVSRLFLLLAGDADVAAITRDRQLDVMEPDGTPRYTSIRIVKDRPSFDVTVFGYNQAINATASPDPLEIPPTFFNDTSVRRAFSYAFDYDDFLQNVTVNMGIQLRGPIAQGVPGYNMSTPTFAFNLSRAAAELQQTPFWNGFKITLYYNAGNTERERGCLILKRGLEALHAEYGAGEIQVAVRALDWPVYLDAFRANGIPIVFLGWRPDYADPDNYVMPFLRTGGVFATRIGYSNATLDALIDAASAELNQTDRVRMYRDLTSRAVVDDVPYLWVYQSRSFHVERAWVRGYYFNPMLSGLDYHRLWKATG